MKSAREPSNLSTTFWVVNPYIQYQRTPEKVSGPR